MNSGFLRHAKSLLIAVMLVAAFGATSPASPAYAAGITVDSSADNVTGGDNACTLREAIANANSDSDTTSGDCTAGSGTDMITFDAGLTGATIPLSLGTLSLGTPMTIDGASLGITIDANYSSRIFSVGSTVTVNGLTITEGNADGGVGGGILNTGNLTLTNSTVSYNNAPSDGGGIYVFVGATLTVKNSTFNNNYSAANGGAIVNNAGTITVINSTINSNTSNSASGGGIATWGNATIINSTIANNASMSGGGGIHRGSSTVTIKNTIIADNNPQNCSMASASGFNNLDDDGTCIVATNSASINLGTFGDYGGLTNTVPVLTGSSAFEAGDPTTCADAGTVNNLDQRGVARPQGATCDVGAFESLQCPVGFYDDQGACTPAPLGTFVDVAGAVNATFCSPGYYQDQTGQFTCKQADPGYFAPSMGMITQLLCPSGTTSAAGAAACTIQSGPNFMVNVDADHDDGACGISPSDCTLREAINAANTVSGADNITFYDNYTITLDGSQLPVVTSQITIYGNGANNTIIEAASTPDTATWRVFEVVSGGNLTLDGVTVRNGRCNGSCATLDSTGGGISNNFGTLSVTNSSISANSATHGGGIANTNGTLTVKNSSFSGNSAGGFGGGVFNNALSGTCASAPSATITNSTFSGNSALLGGGFRNQNGVATLLFNTITANTSGGGLSSFNDSVTCTKAGSNIIAGNSGYDVVANATTQRFASLGYNLVGVAGTNVDFAQEFNASGDLTGPSYDPVLGPLQDNGGSTLTHALLPGSDALEAGDDIACAASPINSLDQRGVARPQNPSCDIGAYEAVPMPDLVITKTNNVGGSVVYPGTWRWSIKVENNGTADATFANGQTIFSDNLPTNASYAHVSTSMSTVPGNAFPIRTLIGSDLTVTADGAFVLPPGKFVTVTYQVTPSAPGTYANPRAGGSCTADSGNVVSESTEGNNTCSDTVTVTAHEVSLSTTSLSFGNQLVGVASAPQTVTVTNTGDADLHIGALGINSDFGLSNDTCSNATVIPTGTCTFDVIFQPLSIGPKAGQVSIPSDAASTPDIVSLDGTGVVVPDGVNLLKKPDFNTPYAFPTPWQPFGFRPPYAAALDCTYFQSAPCSVVFPGVPANTYRAALQKVNRSGLAGDTYQFGLSSSAQNVPAGGNYRVEVIFYNALGKIIGITPVNFNIGTHSFEVASGFATAPANYARIGFRFIYQKSGGRAWFDDAFLMVAP